MNWAIERALGAVAISSSPDEKVLLSALFDAVYGYKYPASFTQSETQKLRRCLLAAAFDLMVAAEYYRTVGHLRWMYCPQSDYQPTIYYPYTSICPYCVLEGNFHYHQAHKPSSGNIGAATSRLLAVFLEALFERHGRKVETFKGSEPIDTIFIDQTTTPKVCLFAEIKSAPLVTLPLAMKTERLTIEEEQGVVSLQTHEPVNPTNLYESSISIFIPTEKQQSSSGWTNKTFPIGNKQGAGDSAWAYRGLANLLKNDPSFFESYSKFWVAAFNAYGDLGKTTPVFWFTNACGQPVPRPNNWPKRNNGSGYESISDGKTSVGMDRTDDIKKSIYQVLKLGAEGKPSENVKYLVGIVSNIHAVRHFDEYIKPLKSIIWTRDETEKVKMASQLPPNTEMFKLFDGIIALTETIARDSWVETTFDF